MDVEKFTDRALGFIQPPQLLVTRDGNRRFTSLHLLKVLLDDEEGLASIAETLARRTGDSFVIALQDRDHSQECRSRLAGGKGWDPAYGARPLKRAIQRYVPIRWRKWSSPATCATVRIFTAGGDLTFNGS